MNLPPSSPTRPVVAFLTDFGYSDGYVGVMKGVVLNITPEAQLVDITHSIPSQNIVSGAWTLATGYRYFPRGTVFICVVDPGVGSSRRPVAIHVGDWFFVGPDNGLFSYVLAEQAVHEAVTLSNTAYHLPQISTTFHGRDVFSPAAAYIVRGLALAELGPRIDPASLQRIDPGLPIRHGSLIEAHIIHVDHFGNLITSIPLHMVPDLFTSPAVRLTFPSQGITIRERRRFFSAISPGDENEARPFIYGDSSAHLSVAIRNGNAAATLHVNSGDLITFGLGNGQTETTEGGSER